MSDINVNYKLSYKPSPITCKARLSMRDKEVRVSLEDVPKVLFTATPVYSRNVVGNILSTIGTPIINCITATLGLFAKELLHGKTFNIWTIPEAKVELEGIEVKLIPSNMKLSQRDGALLVTGDFDLK